MSLSATARALSTWLFAEAWGGWRVPADGEGAAWKLDHVVELRVFVLIAASLEPDAADCVVKLLLRGEGDEYEVDVE